MRWFGWFRKKKTAADEQSMMATIGGRTFTRGIPYALPRDLEEMNRLDFQHFLLRQAFKGNYAAPIGNPGSILDVGAGTGRWAREMALLFPQAQVVGIDVNVPPVDEAASGGAASEPLPPNYRFVAGNVLEGLPFPDASFDFVHMRLLVAGIPHDRWPGVIKELARVTQPGGWVESVESPSLQRGGPATERIIQWIRDLSAR